MVVTDPGSALEELAQERGFLGVVGGEPSIGGRYSALSPFGILPAAVMGVDIRRLLERAEEMREACRFGEGNPGLELGLALGESWRQGRDKVALTQVTGGFDLWVQQLLAESTGKQDKGLIPVEGDGPDVQTHEVRLESPYELGQEFFRWEFATAVAGSILGINPFDQPDVQAAKDKTSEVLERGGEVELEPQGSLEELLASAGEGDYVAICAFVDPAREGELEPLVERVRATGRPLMRGLGPRYLHSTGQLHKGGPSTGLYVQVVDDLGEELEIPGQAVRLPPAHRRAGRGRLRGAARARAPHRARATRRRGVSPTRQVTKCYKAAAARGAASRSQVTSCYKARKAAV